MTAQITYTKSRISLNQAASVSVECSELVYAYECRATLVGEPQGRGMGINVLKDEGGYDSDGVVTLNSPTRFIYFSVSGDELISAGDYNINVYLKTQNGWETPTVE